MLAFNIALRYLFAPKSHSAINTITLVAACGVGIITAAMICVLSVYNGFEGLVSDLTSRFDPDLRIEATVGKGFTEDPQLRALIEDLPEVESVNVTLEETVLLSYSGHQVPAKMKGVEDTFAEVTQIDSILLGTDGFLLEDEVAHYCILGAGLGSTLGMSRGFVRPLSVYCPRRTGKIDLLNPEESFSEMPLYCSNIFMVQQSQYDDQYFLCSLSTARELLGDSLLTTAYEVKLSDGTDADKVKAKILSSITNNSSLLTPHSSLNPNSSLNLRVLTQHEQQADAYRIMQIEKWISYLLVVFILLIASFNIIGALSMLMIDKSSEITTLRNLGASNSLIKNIFTLEGWLISGSGAILGVILGVTLCLIQQHFGIISLGAGVTAQYVVNAYPVHLLWSDVLLTLLSVTLIGWLATAYTIRSTQKV